MATLVFYSLIFSFILLENVRQSLSLGVGINYGQIADNLPTPTTVAGLLNSLRINRVKLYDADPKVLSAFANTNVEFIIAIGNENLVNMTDSTKAEAWIEENVRPFLPQTKISCITVGNELLTGSDTLLISNLLPAMQSVHQALVKLGLDDVVTVSSAHAISILSSSFPPSAGSFSENVAGYILPLLNFHAQINSPFLINAYPYFAYKGDPTHVSLQYVLFQNNSGVIDPNTNLLYDNMLYAQIDAVYAAIKALGHTDIVVRISETGWPSKGDSDEPGATVENAGMYNRNLLKRISMKQGTPMKPNVPIDVYVFALFNENQKPGPTSERNYGLFYPNGTPVYDVGQREYIQTPTYPSFFPSCSRLLAPYLLATLLSVVTASIWTELP